MRQIVALVYSGAVPEGHPTINMNDEVPAVSLDDVGSRYIHLAELLEMWEIGIEILVERIRSTSYASGSDMPARLKKLEAAAETLRGTMDGMSSRIDYQWKLGNQIDDLFKQKDFNRP